MTIIPVNPIPSDNRLYTNITPFTVRDNATYLIVLESLRKYINDVLVPFVNENVANLDAEWTAEVNRLIEAWNTQSTELIEYVDNAVQGVGDYKDAAEAAQKAAEQARDLAEQYASQVVAVQDAAMAALLNDDDSLTRAAIDALIGGSEALNQVIDTVNTGRLSEDALNARFDAKAGLTDFDNFTDLTNAALDAMRTDITGKADVSVQNTVETGRLSALAIDNRFDLSAYDSVMVNMGGKRAQDKFDRLINGIINEDSDTRVIVLGSSNANSGLGAYVTQPEKATYWRLAYRSGAIDYPQLSTVAAPVGAGRMRWWNGAQGNTTSADYFPEARRTQLVNVRPDIVFHQIGENDFYYGTPISNYIANMRSAFEFIEGTNPDVLNIATHSPSRRDVASPAASWNDYRDALKSVVDEKPDTRFFVDSTDVFGSFNMGTGNTAGMFYDSVHLNDNGNLVLADLISDIVGIPSETNYLGGRANDMVFSIPDTAAYTVQGARLATISFASVKYPRMVEINGSVWGTHAGVANANCYLQTQFADSLGGTSDNHAVRFTPASISTPVVNSRHYVKPRAMGDLRVLLFPNGTLTINGSSILSRLVATFRAV